MLPADQGGPAEAPDGVGGALLLLAAMHECLQKIEASNQRICEAIERLLPRADDPRYKQTGGWR